MLARPEVPRPVTLRTSHVAMVENSRAGHQYVVLLKKIEGLVWYTIPMIYHLFILYIYIFTCHLLVPTDCFFRTPLLINQPKKDIHGDHCSVEHEPNSNLTQGRSDFQYKSMKNTWNKLLVQIMVVDLQPFYGASAGAFTVIGIPKMFLIRWRPGDQDFFSSKTGPFSKKNPPFAQYSHSWRNGAFMGFYPHVHFIIQ